MTGEAEDLTDESLKLAEPLVPVFGIDLIKKVFASDWHLREEGLNGIMNEIKLGSKSGICGDQEPEKIFTAFIGVLANTCGDKIAQVSITCSDYMKSIC